MSIYKTIDPNSFTTRQRTLFKSQSLTNSSSGLNIYSYESASTDGSGFVREGISGSKDSLYNSLLVNFYLSGSSYNDKDHKYSNPEYTTGPWQNQNFHLGINPIHNNKFHSQSAAGNTSGIIFSVPLNYYGELIKPGSFKLISRANPTDIEIKDDKFGNLYVNPKSTVSSHSESYPYPDITGSLSASISSSANYIGNIFYHMGIVSINEHNFVRYGYSSSADTTINGIGQQFSMSFNGVKNTFTSIYTVKVNPGEFNYTANPTAYEYYNTSSFQYGDKLHAPLTGSGEFSPYFNQIGFYGPGNYKGESELLMVGKYNQNIERNYDIPLLLKVTMDW